MTTITIKCCFDSKFCARKTSLCYFTLSLSLCPLTLPPASTAVLAFVLCLIVNLSESVDISRKQRQQWITMTTTKRLQFYFRLQSNARDPTIHITPIFFGSFAFSLLCCFNCGCCCCCCRFLYS